MPDRSRLRELLLGLRGVGVSGVQGDRPTGCDQPHDVYTVQFEAPVAHPQSVEAVGGCVAACGERRKLKGISCSNEDQRSTIFIA